MTHKASLSGFVKVTTIIINTMFVLTFIGFFTFLKDSGKEFQIVTGTIFFLVFVITYSLRPIHYTITENQLIIHRLYKDVVIEKTDIKSVSILDEKKLEWSIRTFGVGGYYGFFGKFANTQMGNMTWYATRKDNTVLILTEENEKIIITPNEPEAFVVDYYKL
ncbi:PH domain-containing protein [Arcicella rigui]|uniref:PH domain-containing protein n=1 Tax=Arcicella rigui TaxID=797020 RepID=A0ABU5Q5L8_9BACT|nr:PH domain-containing protein [Arcicella rigui]MEA5138120.1 PH domain-containing protein [Arcicella rigui]